MDPQQSPRIPGVAGPQALASGRKDRLDQRPFDEGRPPVTLEAARVGFTPLERLTR
jgi:hypothetical protein